MKIVISAILAICLIAGFSACSNSPASQEQPPLPTGNIIGEYKIGVGDQLSVSVWRNPELSLSVPVRPDGKISVPLIGDVVAQGATAEELSKTITTLMEKYIRGPQVAVIVTDANSTGYLLRVRITGAINNPISIPHRDGMTVLDLALEASGPSPFAASNRAKLYRKVDGEVKVYSIKLDDILKKGKLKTNYILAPSDIVTVPERIF